jgi:hypothetical protein
VLDIDQNGVPIYSTNKDEVTGMEIADWIKFASSSLTIPGGGSASAQFTITIPEDATPGSHIGTVFVTVNPPDIDSVGAAVAYQVGSNVVVRVAGDIIEQANIRQFSTGKFFYTSQDVDFSVRIENLGNVLVKPVGPLEIYNMLGENVATLTFNEEQRMILPFSERTFSNILWNGDGIGFGRYEAVLSPVYGNDGAVKTMSSTATFWILPMHIIGPAILALVVLLGVVFLFVRLYIKRSLAHMSQGRRLITRKRRGNSSAALLLIVVMLTTTALFLIVLLALFA